MSNTTFVDAQTPVVAAWLNDVNDAIYDVLGDGTNAPTTAEEVKTNLGIVIDGFKNRIINGAMMIDQRSNGASTTITPTGGFIFASCDRWSIYSSVASKVSVQQNAGSVTPPAGFKNYLGITTVSAYSPASGDLFALTQQIEGFNVADFSWGTANAATVTLSFWVRSSLTGTFGGCLMNGAYDRSYPFLYTISSANTWTRITLTVDGDTTGTWLTDNGMGIRVSFSLGAGSTIQGTANAWASGSKWSVTGETQIVGTNGATFYITGVQLEKNSTATSFDYRPYGTELELCYRYYVSWGGSSLYERLTSVGTWNSSTVGAPHIHLPVDCRDPSSISVGYSSLSHLYAVFSGLGATPTSLSIDMVGKRILSLTTTVTGGPTSGQSCFIAANDTTSARLYVSNEL